MLRSEEILPSDHSRMVEQAKFTYSSLRKAFEKRIKIMKDPRNKQVEGLKFLKTTKQKLAIEDAIPDDQLNEAAKNQIELIKKKNGKNRKKRRFML